MVEKRYYASPAAFTAKTDNASMRVHYTFDALGRTLTAVSGQGTTTMVYDAEGRTTRVDSPEGTLRYEYDDATGRLTRTYTDATDTRYAYDELGRMKTASVHELGGTTYATPQVTTYSFDILGSLKSTTLPNGVTTSYVYDNLNRLDLATVKRGTTTLAGYDYALLSDGQRDYVVETDAGGATTKVDWTYDGLDRLTREVYDVGNDGVNGASDFDAAYTLDLVGNRKAKATDKDGPANDETVTLTYSPKDELLTETSSRTGTTTYGYDANGSQVTQTRGGVTSVDAYDLRNRLVGHDANGDGDALDSGDVSYAYGDGERRASQTVGDGTPNGQTTLLLVDPMNPTGYSQVVEEKATKTATPTRGYAVGLDVLGQMANGTLGWLMHDGGGSTRAILDGTGQVATNQVHAYDAFGNAIAFDPAAAGTRLLYRGERFDTLLGRYDLRARGYDPTTGRFPTMDGYRAGNGDLHNQNLYATQHQTRLALPIAQAIS